MASQTDPDMWPYDTSVTAADGRPGPPRRLVAPPTRPAAGWYADGALPIDRYFDGRTWTGEVRGRFTTPPRADAPSLDVRAAVGAAVVLIVSLIASRYALEFLVRYDWPIAAYAVISVLLGYGPSVAWCVVASRRWGTGRVAGDLGVRFRWSDLGWGPLVWITVIGAEVLAVVVIRALGVPLTSNTEGINDLSIDRTYVISLLITAVVAAPIVEEMVFRGLMLRGLRSRLSAGPAIAVQGVLFGIAHVDPVRGAGNIGLVLVLSGVGVTLGGAAHLLGRIGPTVLAHAILNGVVMAVVLAG